MRRTVEDVIVLHAIQDPEPTPEQDEKHTVYFDGSCPLCSLEISHYAAIDRDDNVEFVDVSGDQMNLGENLSCHDARRRFHVRLPDGTLVSGARAFIALWEALPGWRRIAPIARIPGVPTLMEGLYRVFLLIRPALSRAAAVFGARAANAKS